MADRKKELVAGLAVIPEDPRLTYQPFKDTLLLVLSAFLVGVIVFVTYTLIPKSDNTHAEIRYQTTLLWDKEDSTKNTALSFPKTGNRTLVFLRTDGPLYLGEGKDFDFYGDEVDVTLYADKSIRITKEDSPRHVCSNLGRIYGTYTPLVCLPNSLQAMIVADGFPTWDN
jgi:hypothetical protein